MVVLFVILVAILGELYTERGSLLSTAIFVYAATAPVNGYFGGSLYARMGGKVWIRQMVLSAFLVPVGVCGTAFFINFIAMYYHASRAIPIGTMVSQVPNSSVCPDAMLLMCGFLKLKLRSLMGRKYVFHTIA